MAEKHRLVGTSQGQDRPLCPVCRVPMGKGGFGLSGKRPRQLWRCRICKRRTMRVGNVEPYTTPGVWAGEMIDVCLADRVLPDRKASNHEGG